MLLHRISLKPGRNVASQQVPQPSGRLRSFGCGSDHSDRQLNQFYFSVEALCSGLTDPDARKPEREGLRNASPLNM